MNIPPVLFTASMYVYIYVYIYICIYIYIYIRGVTIRVFVLNRSVRGFRFGTHYKPNDSLD